MPGWALLQTHLAGAQPLLGTQSPLPAEHQLLCSALPGPPALLYAWKGIDDKHIFGPRRVKAAGEFCVPAGNKGCSCQSVSCGSDTQCPHPAQHPEGCPHPAMWQESLCPGASHAVCGLWHLVLQLRGCGELWELCPALKPFKGSVRLGSCRACAGAPALLCSSVLREVPGLAVNPSPAC